MANKIKYIPALGYDFLTKVYDWVIYLTMPEQKIRRKILNLINPKFTKKILDFGVGTASQAILIKQNYPDWEVFGLDIDEKVQKIAHKKVQKTQIHLQLDLYEGANFPYKSDFFDCVVSSLVFHQLSFPQKINALQEMYRVLRPQGTLIIGDFGKPANLWMRWAFYGVQLIDGFVTTHENLRGLLPQMIEKEGFKQVRVESSTNTLAGTFCYYVAEKV